MFFSAEQIRGLVTGLAEVKPKLATLQERIVIRPFRAALAREHADHGLARRLGVMARCIERTFELLPPDLDEIPDTERTLDAAINIQAFVMSSFGCCENIAWIWVSERDVRLPTGAPLLPKQIGLGPGYPKVRDALTPRFRDYLDQRAGWFNQLKDYRDALAHRIPLYIPPYMVDPRDADHFDALGCEAVEALRAHDFDGYERLTDEKMGLARFRPVMAHSLTAQANVVIFHYQLLSDFGTIGEMAGVLLDELDR